LRSRLRDYCQTEWILSARLLPDRMNSIENKSKLGCWVRRLVCTNEL
jgi:hypothetical protein